MAIKTINAQQLKKCFLTAAKSIEAQKEVINELNVFPVPDGDTGTNMTMTIMSAANDVSRLQNPTMEQLAKCISNGSLCGARGNSGVILSQLFRGFCKEIGKVEEIDVTVMCNAFQKAVETAYKAVMKPKEGTILTVAKGGAEKAAELAGETDDLEYFGAEVLKHMRDVLDYTPELLPVLKEAGVVDSGGTGLVVVVQGAYDALLGKELDFTPAVATSGAATRMSSENISTSDIKFGYCTEFIINLEKPYNEQIEEKLKSFLESIGDSVVCVSLDTVVKIHVHTNDPGLALQRALTLGSLSRIKIDNMREEHNEKLLKEMESDAEKKPEAPAGPKKDNGFVAVSIGEGINEIFKGLGVDYIIEGGQTMNPSTEDMLKAIKNINADTIFILPNNKNIILAAEQARSMTEDKKIVVIPSKNIPQGIAAMIGFIPDASAEENAEAMTESMANVKTGQVTYAVRDTSIDGFEIKNGNIMGIGDKGILAVEESVVDATVKMVESMVDEDSELVSLYYGEEVTEEQATELAAKLSEVAPDCDVEVHFGGQPIYYYVVSVE